MLSNVDIIKELNKNIFIYPFEEKNIKSASINLTASNMAWSITTKKSVIEDNKIKIPPHDTTLVYSNEIVSITNKLGGTFHSRVKDVSMGCGHIGTTLNPGWFGRLLVAITNHTNENIFISIDDSFVTLYLYYLNTKSSNEEDENNKSRQDILTQNNIVPTAEQSDILNEEDPQTIKRLKELINDKGTYRKIKNTRKINKWFSILFLNDISKNILIVLITLIIKEIWDKIFN